MIQTYSDGWGGLEPYEDEDRPENLYVNYADHLAEMAKKDHQIAILSVKLKSFLKPLEAMRGREQELYFYSKEELKQLWEKERGDK